MKVGDLAYDIVTKQYVVIVDKDVTWKDSDDQVHRWDFEVMAEGVGVYMVDMDELRDVNNESRRFSKAK